MRKVHWGLLAICLVGIGVNQASAAGEVEPAANAAGTTVVDKTDPKVVRRFHPIYPESAVKRMIEGWVELEFFVELDGEITSVEPVRAAPSGVFEKAVLKAFAKWKYQPGTLDGIPVRQSQHIIMTLQMADSAPSQKFLDGYEKTSLAINKGDFKAAQKKLSELERRHTRTLRERVLLNVLYADYHIERNDNLRAIYYLRAATGSGSHNKNEEERDSLLSTLFDLEVAEGYSFAALNTYNNLKRNNVEVSATTHIRASELRAKIEAGSQLAANGLLHGSCYKCRRGTAMWSHGLKFRQIQFTNVTGRLTSLKLDCAYHWETYAKVPETLISIPREWGRCQVRVKGKTGTTFTLVED